MRTKILILCCLIGILFSCSTKSEQHSESRNEVNTSADNENQVAEMVMAPAPSDSKSGEYRLETNAKATAQQTAVDKQKIIKDGNITVKSNNINNSKKGIDNLLKKLNAYYESEDLQNNEQSISYTLKIRIPAVNFEKLITNLENGEDEIESKNIQARDVTEEYVDIETRLITKRQYLQRYKQILAKAATVKDILAIEENIRNLEEEIDSQQGRLKYLADQVAFSTLNISLYKNKEYIEQPKSGFLTRTKMAINQGWQSIVDFMLWAISIWPYLIVGFVSFFIIRRIIKSRKTKKSID
ncbi:hypothetical protein D3C87_266480 [compost metagenome]